EELSSEAEALTKLNECSSRLWRCRTLHQGLDEMLRAIIELLGADKGGVQLLNTEGALTVMAQRGFDDESLQFFYSVTAEDESAGGRALKLGDRIIIEDVETDPLYERLRPVARAAGYRAVVSTPLVAGDGSPLGMLTTHFGSVHRPTDQELRRLDLYA